MRIKMRGLFLSKDETSYGLLKEALKAHHIESPHHDLKTEQGMLVMCEENEKMEHSNYFKGLAIIKEMNQKHVLKDTFWLNHYQQPVDLAHYQILLGFPKLSVRDKEVQGYQQQLQDYLKCYILAKEVRFGTLFEANTDSYERTYEQLTDFLNQNGTGPFQKVKRLEKDGREPFEAFPREIR